MSAGDLKRLDRLPGALPALLAHDLERPVADEPAEARPQIDELRVRGTVLGRPHRGDLDLDGVRRGRRRDDPSNGEQENGRTPRSGHGWAAGALTMMSVVPYFRSRRSSRRGAPLSMRSMTAWFGRTGRAATRTGEGALLSQKSALAAASPTPQTGASRIRRTQARRASMRSAACATAGHTPARSSRSTSPSIVCSSASRSPVSSRTAVSHAGHAPAWRATASSMGAGSSASTKRSSRSATSVQVMRGSDETPQPGLELAARVVEAAHHRAFRTLEHLAYILVGEPFQLA